LQKNTAAITKNARDAASRIVAARLSQNGVGGFRALEISRAAGVKKANQHDENPLGDSYRVPQKRERFSRWSSSE
jgi:hypothetical protein